MRKAIGDNYRGLHMSRINRRWFRKKRSINYKIIIGLLCVAALFVSGVLYWKSKSEQPKEDELVMDVQPEKDVLVEEEDELTVDPSKPMIALTFDDGPGKYTDRLLEVLETNHARATFFMVGQNVGRYPNTIKKMKELGCDIGNHTMNHRNLVKLSGEDIQIQIESTNDALKKIVDEGATLVRPPYGSEDTKVREHVEYPLVMWSVDTNDWQTEDVAGLVDYIMHNVKDGDIVLMHDIYDSSVEAAVTVIPKLIENGYQLVTIRELAEAREVSLENGKVYGRFYP